MKKILLFLITLSLTSVMAQVNIVPNPSFEFTTGCPSGTGQWYNCQSWQSPYASTIASSYCGSPDYYDASCLGSYSPVNNGNVSAHTGNGMMGLCLYNYYALEYREYITARLKCDMLPGITYTVSFWASLASITNNSMTVKYVGAYLSATAPVQTCGERLNYTPQLETTSNSAIGTTWTRISMVITPTTTLKYITLGNFKNDATSNPTPYSGYTGTNSYGYYFFDDIEVSTPFNLSTNLSQLGCGNVNSATVIASTNPGYTYSYAWSYGGYTSASASNLPPGVYTVSVTATNSCISTTKSITFTMTPNQTPTLAITQSTAPYCSGQTTTLMVTGASTYTWLPGGSHATSIVIVPTGGTTYSVSGTNSFGCVGTATYYVAPPLPNPTVNISTSSSVRCSGAACTLTGSGASTYSWQPGSYTGNPYLVDPPTATAYTVRGKAANGCTATAVYTVAAALPNPTLNITPSSTFICAGIPSTLTASGATTYTWHPVISNASSVAVTPTAATVYYVFGSYTTGCQSYSTVTITPGLSIGLAAGSDVSYCNNAAPNVSISATSTLAPGYIAYQWTPGYLYGPTVAVNPTVNTIYTVHATYPGACPETGTLAVSVTTDCCSQSVEGLTPISDIGGGYYNNSYFIANSITLSSSATFDSAEFLMMPGVQIIVPSGVRLELLTSHLYACGINMWQGIVVQDGGQVVTKNGDKGSNMIEDAVIAIDVDGITTSAASPPVQLDNVIFNKNYIGVKLSNASSAITALPIGLTECVFASRDMPFTGYPNPLSWPNTFNTSGGLREPYSPTATQGLVPPFKMQGYAQASLKLPYPSQQAHIGIKIDNIGVSTGAPPVTGVDMGFTYPSGLNMYNVFDGLDVGIDVNDASLMTMNNVFQNSGTGINHNVSGIMNAGLNLVPATASTDYGNNFWDCTTGVQTHNVLQVDIQYGIYRSSMANGKTGIFLESNRFEYDIEQCELNNLDQGILINTDNGQYQVSDKERFGTYAGNITISQNYLGSQVNSTIPPGAEFLNHAITLNDLGGGSWNIAGACHIFSNKIDRAFRGIYTNRTDDYPVEIGGNDIQISDDNMLQPFTNQYGIYVNESRDNLQVTQNIVKGEGVRNPYLKLIRSVNNTSSSGNQSPVVTCNEVSDGYIGFEFEGSQLNTTWTGNIMNQKMYIGLSLLNNGEIGTQGSMTSPCMDQWLDNGNVAPDDWMSNYQTYVSYSNASPGSFLWCQNNVNELPTANGGFSGMVFSMGASIDISKQDGIPCQASAYPATPAQRGASPATVIKSDAAVDRWSAEIFPNPSNGNLSIRSTVENEVLHVSITDVTGKVVYAAKLSNNTTGMMDLSSLKASVYFVEIRNGNDKITRKKLIITKE